MGKDLTEDFKTMKLEEIHNSSVHNPCLNIPIPHRPSNKDIMDRIDRVESRLNELNFYMSLMDYERKVYNEVSGKRNKILTKEDK